ncbi:MAG: hypothetical protein JXA87_07775 [Thermoleophilia bacterium]|nr:hypothetical protein [Thermoleophilia bacterium]
MEAGFWHLISDGLVEDERLPDLRRCERIAWPRPMIEADGTEQVNVWLSRGEAWKRGSRVAIALRDFSYVAILEYAGNHMLLVTAYLVEHDHRREKLRRQFEADKKMTPPLGGDVSTPSTAW